MAATTGLVGFLTRVAPADRRTDGELVREYATCGSDAAFTELVRRFAPLVWSVCRRTTGHRQLAEDAFQATFLVLARKAGSVRPSAVGGWLHAVAVHTATRARTVAHRQRKRHHPLISDPVSPMPVEPTDPDTLRALDEEIARLPDHLRVAVALCELDGVSRREAAKRLGIAEGTLSSRLAVARKTLAARLRGRGVALPAALALVSHAGSAGSCQGSPPPPVSSTVSNLTATLADGVIRTMLLNKLKRITAVLAVLAVSTLGSVAVAAPPDHSLDRYRIKAPVPKAVPREGVVCVALATPAKDARLLLLKPDGEVVKTIELTSETAAFVPALSPDATRVAVFLPTPGNDKRAQAVAKRGGWAHGRVVVYDLDRPEKPVAEVMDAVSPVYAWAADGATLYVSEVDPKADGVLVEEGAAYPWMVSAFDPATGKRTPLGLPAGHVVVGTSPDGKTLVTAQWTVNKATARVARAYTAPLATLKPEAVPDTTVGPRSMTPAGDRFVGFRPRPGADRSTPLDPFLVDVRTGKETAVELGDDTEWVQDVRVSPDGKRVLAHRQVRLSADAPNPPAVPGVPVPAPGPGPAAKRLKAEVAIRDAGGGTPKVIYEPRPGEQVTGVDWR